VDTLGRAPLHYCMLLEAHQVARLLIKRGAQPHIRDHSGATPLDLAIQRGRIRDEELLVRLSSI
jgi:Arf-GAP with coiled-coil, ANK repeat and PH domain-containing protein